MEKNKSMKKVFIVPIVITIGLGLLLFLPAGTIHYWNGWAFLCIMAGMTFFISVFFTKKSPDLLARRMKVKEDPSSKTPVIFKLYILGYILPGFDMRFHWSKVPTEAAIIGNIIVFLGYLFIFFVLNENRYASTVIQVEEDQKVITTGPYSIVRHPMYLGLVLMLLATPVALGSWIAMLPMLLSVPMHVYRIRKEESLLRTQLKGYEEYCEKTRYRLIPFIW